MSLNVDVPLPIDPYIRVEETEGRVVVTRIR